MIKSISSSSLPTRYVYFNNEGTISKISSKIIDDDADMWALFKIEDVIPFIDGTYRFSDYLVSKIPNELGYSIIKKKVDMKSRAVETQIKKISTCKNAEIVVRLKNNTILVKASNAILETQISTDQEVMVAGKSSHPFFLTMKDRPDFIIKEISVPYNLLLTGIEFSEYIKFKNSEVSVYTRPYFNSYSLEK